MKHRILVMIFVFALVTGWNISLMGSGENTDTLIKEYNSIETKYQEKIKTIKSREEYQAMLKEWTAEMEALQQKVEKATPNDDLTLLKGRILLDLRKNEEAVKIFDQLISSQSPKTLEAKYHKTRTLIALRDYKGALALFEEVEKTNAIQKTIKIDKTYGMILLEFSFSAPDNTTKTTYAEKFLKIAETTKDPTLERYSTMIYENLAKIEQDKGNTKKAVEILENAMNKMSNEEAKKELAGSLKQLKLLGIKAPEINAENWLNGTALKLNDLKGKAVIIDFWAPWCNPCRMVIPTLVKKYNALKDKGLVVIGFTRIYGSYSDEQGSKGKVAPEEERKLIAEFVKRNNIMYPIAIADGLTAFEAYSVGGIPTMVMIDKNGNIKNIEVGAGDEKELEAKIDALLK